jgi:hypothetical protein
MLVAHGAFFFSSHPDRATKRRLRADANDPNGQGGAALIDECGAKSCERIAMVDADLALVGGGPA